MLVCLGGAVCLFHFLRSREGRDSALEGKKNVVLITLDALRADHLSCYGYIRQTTPNIDVLAAKGFRFDTVITSGCSTKASLTSLFTGLDYRYHKIISHTEVLSDSFLTLAEVFHQNGYDTAGFTATPMIQKSFNYQQGFGVYEDFMTVKQSSYISAGRVVARVLDWLDERRNDAPFFIYVHFQEPHPPWDCSSPWLSNEEEESRFFGRGCAYIPTQKELIQISADKIFNLIAKYDGAVYFADQQVGRILNKLKAEGLLDKTVVAVSSDHGMELLDHGSTTHGYCPYDEVVKIPLVVYPGEALPQPKVIKKLGRIFDIGPTLLGLAGLPVPEAYEGRSLLHKANPEPKLAFTFGYDVVSVRTPRYKLVSQNIRNTYSRFWKKPGYELYDLQLDPREQQDISQKKPKLFNRLKSALDTYRDDLENMEFIAGTRIPRKKHLDEETTRRLRTLGYIQ